MRSGWVVHECTSGHGERVAEGVPKGGQTVIYTGSHLSRMARVRMLRHIDTQYIDVRDRHEAVETETQ